MGLGIALETVDLYTVQRCRIDIRTREHTVAALCVVCLAWNSSGLAEVLHDLYLCHFCIVWSFSRSFPPFSLFSFCFLALNILFSVGVNEMLVVVLRWENCGRETMGRVVKREA